MGCIELQEACYGVFDYSFMRLFCTFPSNISLHRMIVNAVMFIHVLTF